MKVVLRGRVRVWRYSADIYVKFSVVHGTVRSSKDRTAFLMVNMRVQKA
jgi:hypothetical protein